MASLSEKELYLRSYLRKQNMLAIAFSGGVDSTLLLKLAAEELGDKVIAVSAKLPMTSADDFRLACDFCKELGIKQVVCQPDVLSIPEVSSNDPKRCYFCKKALFTAMKTQAEEQGFFVIADGTNTDDLGDYRPGLLALEELEVVSPFLEAGFSKEDIRVLSKQLGLSTWNKQSNACLATRVPYGSTLDVELLALIDRCEQKLHSCGFSQARLRVQDKLARIEVNPQDFELLISDDVRSDVVAFLKNQGFAYVTLDLEGFRSGSMNTALMGEK